MKRICVIVLAIALVIMTLAGCSLFDDDSGSVNTAQQENVNTVNICGSCNGEGYYACPICSGEGIAHGSTCYFCGGKGVTICTVCDGDGIFPKSSGGSGGNNVDYYVPDYSPDLNIGGNQTTCPICGGEGRVICSSCHGTGSLQSTGYAPDFTGGGNNTYQIDHRCAACSGTGWSMCTHCMGTGLI